MAPKREPAPATEDEIDRATSIEPEAIQEEYARASSDLRHFRDLLADAKEASDLADLVAEEAEAAAVVRIRRENNGRAKTDPEYLTADDVKAAARGAPERVRAVSAAIRLHSAKDKLYGICDAIRLKAEMLVSLGADLREDRHGGRGRG